MGRDRAITRSSSRWRGCCHSNRSSNRTYRGKERCRIEKVGRAPHGCKDRYASAPSPDRCRPGFSRSTGNTTTTIFIDNVHREVSEYQLGKIVRRFARWSRLYISRKWRSWNWNACAFVDVYHVEDAKRVIEGIKGWNINGSSLSARMEFQGHKEKKRSGSPTGSSSRSNNPSSQVQKEYISVKSRLSIKVKADEGMKACLSKCAVISLQDDMNPKEALKIFTSRWPNLSGLLALSRKKFLMLFNSANEAKEVVSQTQASEKDPGGLVAHLWVREDQVEKRRTWVVLRGIPLHAWNKKNVRKIAQTVGDVVKIEEEESQFVENAEIRVQVETTTLQVINWKIAVKVEGHSFPVAIVEVGDKRISPRNTDPEESIVQLTDVDGVRSLGQKCCQNVDRSPQGSDTLSVAGEQPVSQAAPTSGGRQYDMDRQAELDKSRNMQQMTLEVVNRAEEGLTHVVQENVGVVTSVRTDESPDMNVSAAYSEQGRVTVGQYFNPQSAPLNRSLLEISAKEGLEGATSPLLETPLVGKNKYFIVDAMPQHVAPFNNSSGEYVASINNSSGECELANDKIGVAIKNSSGECEPADEIIGVGIIYDLARKTQDEQEEEMPFIPEDFFQEASHKAVSPTSLSSIVKTGTDKIERGENFETPHQQTVVEETQIPARDEWGKIINAEREAEECMDLLLQLGCEVPNPSLTKANLLSQIQANMSN